ncbi:transcriptional regulator [Streptomyces sp. NPDC046759]|uniref:transcriptional regulator n=1 Tax=Streptomyces sp. NPDC046759 TaxID=3155019 RepID=UPI0033FB5EB0
MTVTATDPLRTTTGALAPDPGANAFVARVERGEAPVEGLARLALEQQGVIPADRRSFERLANRAAPGSAAFFTTLAAGEELAATRLEAFARACGVTEDRSRAHAPLAGCQACPAYVSWPALNASPADVVLALTANFSAWGGYCARVAEGLRTPYGFTAEACGFFDTFAEPAPDLDRQATIAVQEGLDTGTLDPDRACTYGSLLQVYEGMFWTSLG